MFGRKRRFPFGGYTPGLYDFLAALGRVMYATDAAVIQGELISGGSGTLKYQGNAGIGVNVGTNAYYITLPTGATRLFLSSDPLDASANSSLWFNTSTSGKQNARWETDIIQPAITVPDFNVSGWTYINSYYWQKNTFAVSNSRGGCTWATRNGATFDYTNVNNNFWTWNGPNYGVPTTEDRVLRRGTNVVSNGTPADYLASVIYGTPGNYASIPTGTEGLFVGIMSKAGGAGVASSWSFLLKSDGTFGINYNPGTTVSSLGGSPPTLTTGKIATAHISLSQVFGAGPIDSRLGFSALFLGTLTDTQARIFANLIALGVPL